MAGLGWLSVALSLLGMWWGDRRDRLSAAGGHHRAFQLTASGGVAVVVTTNAALVNRLVAQGATVVDRRIR